MKKFVIFPNEGKDPGYTVTRGVIDRLRRGGGEIYLHRDIPLSCEGAVRYGDEFPEVDLLVVIGGDGSVLDASCQAVAADIPLLGVNRGRLGYLGEVEPDNLQILDRLFTGEYRVEGHMLLSVAVAGEMCPRLAVNDVVVTHGTALGMAEFLLSDGRDECVKYRADGLILSTPAGSTAYSFSAGGPVVAHGVPTVLATPVCPHGFFNRSILFPAQETLRVRNVSAAPMRIHVDGRVWREIGQGEECTVQVAQKRMRMLSFSDNTMFTNLFRKMKISEELL